MSCHAEQAVGRPQPAGYRKRSKIADTEYIDTGALWSMEDVKKIGMRGINEVRWPPITRLAMGGRSSVLQG